MDIKELRDILKRAEGLFRGSGADEQANAVKGFDRALVGADDSSVEDFVEDVRRHISLPPTYRLEASEVAELLEDLRIDRQNFQELFAALGDRKFSKAKAIEVAAIYTGAGPKSGWKTKKAALKAIKAKFDERVYLAAKSKLNEKVTPY